MGELLPRVIWTAEHVGTEPVALGEVVEKNEQISMSWPVLAALGKVLPERDELKRVTAGVEQKQRRGAFRVGKANHVCIWNSRK